MNPYDPPASAQPSPWYWDSSVLSQGAFVSHLLILLAYCLLTFESEAEPAKAILEVDPLFHFAMAACSMAAFVVVIVSTVMRYEWPLHLRVWIIVIDALVVSLLIAVSSGFGFLSIL